MINNFWKTLPQPILMLAPMAGYTESPFRSLVKAIEPSTLLVSELISAEALRRDSKKTRQMCAFSPEEKEYFGIQLFGSAETAFVEAGKVIESLGADFIDLNFGCPSPKVINSGHGSALLKNPKAAAHMIEKLVAAVSIPVSVKMRLGFFDDSDFLDNVVRFESAGISALVVHGRTTKQKFSGIAQWEKIYEAKKRLSIPVIGNGDIDSAEMAAEKIQNLDGVMIGRTALKNPWIFQQCREIFQHGKIMTQPPSLTEQLDFFWRHAQKSVDFKGEKKALLELRKHFCHLIRGIPHATKFRDELIRVSTLQELEKIFKNIMQITV